MLSLRFVLALALPLLVSLNRQDSTAQVPQKGGVSHGITHSVQIDPRLEQALDVQPSPQCFEIGVVLRTRSLPQPGRSRRSMIENLQGGAREAVRVMERASEMARKGEEQVEAAAESLGEIAGEVASINNMNTQIATAAEQQTAVAEEVNRNINTIAAAADNTAEGARQNAQVSEALVNYAHQLEGLVKRFRL